MAVIRVEKSNNYTVMSNYHLKEKEMSLKAKGLLSLMLSLPDDWDYSISGLESIIKENATTIRNVLGELEMFGYLMRERIQNGKGQFEYLYTVYEKPHTEKPHTEKPHTEKPHTEKPHTEKPHTEKPHTEKCAQLNTNKQSTNKQSTNKSNTKHKYGEFQNVLLTDEEVEKLKAKFPDDWEKRIETLSRGIELKGYKYKSHYLAILKWAESDRPTQSRTYTEFWGD